MCRADDAGHMTGDATGARVAFEETQRTDRAMEWGFGLLAVVCGLPAAGLAVLFVRTGGLSVDGTAVAVSALFPAFVVLVFYLPHRVRQLHTTVTDEALAVEMEGLVFTRETRVPLDAVTRVVCWEEFGRMRALVARFSGEAPDDIADRTHELDDDDQPGAAAASREPTTDSYLLRYGSAAPDRTWAGLVRVDRRDGPPVYVGSSRAGELADALVARADTDRDA